MPLLHDVAHLGYAELLTPEPEKSLAVAARSAARGKEFHNG